MPQFWNKWFEQYRRWILRRRMEKADRLISKLLDELVLVRARLRAVATRAHRADIVKLDDVRNSFVALARREARNPLLWSTVRALKPLGDLPHQHLRGELSELLLRLKQAGNRGVLVRADTLKVYLRVETRQMIHLIDSLYKFEGSKAA